MLLLCNCSVIIVLLLCYRCVTVIVLLLCYCSVTVVLLLCYCFVTAVLLLCYCCVTVVLLLCYCRVIGPLHYPVTWYKITHAGVQVAPWDFQNNATRTIPPGPAFVLEVPLRNLRTSMCNFVPCDRIVQRAYYCLFLTLE